MADLLKRCHTPGSKRLPSAAHSAVRQGGVMIERRQVEDKLVASERQYRRLFESAKDGILILDAASGQILDVNPFLINLLSYTRDEFIGKHLWEIGTFKDIADSKDTFARLQTEEYIRYENLPLVTCDGRQIDVEFVSNVYSVGNQEVIQCNIRDITERKRSEVKIENLNRVLLATRRINQLIVREKDPQQLIRQSCEILVEGRGYQSAWIVLADLSGRAHSFAQAGLDNSFADFEDMLRKGQVSLCSTQMKESSSKIVVVNTSATCGGCPLQPAYGCNFSIVAGLHHRDIDYGLMGVSVQDSLAITEEESNLLQETAEDIAFALHEIESETAHEKSKMTLHTIFNSAKDGILLADSETQRFVNANPEMCRML
jgi:PAS domain S-box-containing protein